MSTLSKPVGLILVLLAVCLFGQPAQAKYSGGTGEPNDPYQIATAADLIALGETPEDYDKHFILIADIDLDPNLPGGKVFDGAVIAPDWEMPFTGVFDGNGYAIAHLTIQGGSYLGLFGHLESGAEVKNLGVVDVNVTGSGYGIGGLVGQNYGTVTQCYSTGVVSGNVAVGGLVGDNYEGTVTQCYSTCSVSGEQMVGGLLGNSFSGTVTQCYSGGLISGKQMVGGLLGNNAFGRVTNCYSNRSVNGTSMVGGLVGFNIGDVNCCYSAGAVKGISSVGGLVGSAGHPVTASLWDIQTTGQTRSDGGGTGKTTTEMQTTSTFLDAGWDFVGETANGTEDIWWILEGKDYPRLWWQLAPQN